MPGSQVTQKQRAQRQVTPHDAALYTYDMLISLQRLAELKKHSRLAALIGAAAAEAQMLAAGKQK